MNNDCILCGASKDEIKQMRMSFENKARIRPSKNKYYLSIAKEVSRRSTCLRRQYGAVIVKNDEIISTGYNGAPRGDINCCDTGDCWRETNNIPHGERYEECVSVHAEQNAIISASRNEMNGGILYLYGEENEKPIKSCPCKICKRMIKNAGLTVISFDPDVMELT